MSPMKNKYQIEKILAQNINESHVLKLKDYICYNPLQLSPPLFLSKHMFTIKNTSRQSHN